MNKIELKARSKFLSYLLRHKPDILELSMDAHGWVLIDEIVEKSEHPVTREQIEDIVASNTKQRFAISSDGKRIRANQGHSIPIDLNLAACQPPELLYHGTADTNLSSIQSEGLTRQGRHHVHLSPDPETARQVGMRHGKPVVLTIKARDMHAKCHEFYLTENGVWLCDSVLPEFLQL